MTQPGREAREQAKAYKSVFAPTPLTLDDGTVIEVPPHPNLRMLDDDAQAELEQLEFELESYDRHPDIIIPAYEAKDRNGNLTGAVIPEETVRGSLKVPHRKTVKGEPKLMTPPYTVRVAQIALGDDYAKLRAGTIDGHKGSAADVWRVWNEQGQQIARRSDADPKSDGSSDGVADVATPDSE